MLIRHGIKPFLVFLAQEWTNALGLWSGSPSLFFFRSFAIIEFAPFHPSSECCARQNISCTDVRSQLNSSIRTRFQASGLGSNDIQGSCRSLVVSGRPSTSMTSDSGDSHFTHCITAESGWNVDFAQSTHANRLVDASLYLWHADQPHSPVGALVVSVTWNGSSIHVWTSLLVHSSQWAAIRSRFWADATQTIIHRFNYTSLVHKKLSEHPHASAKSETHTCATRNRSGIHNVYRRPDFDTKTERYTEKKQCK